jgi:hypothetical protein
MFIKKSVGRRAEGRQLVRFKHWPLKRGRKTIIRTFQNKKGTEKAQE